MGFSAILYYVVWVSILLLLPPRAHTNHHPHPCTCARNITHTTGDTITSINTNLLGATNIWNNMKEWQHFCLYNIKCFGLFWCFQEI